MHFVLALSGMIPALFLMWLVDRLDAKRPEPRWTLRKVAIFGGLSTIPCIVVQLALDRGLGIKPTTLGGALFTSYISAGVTEELAKAVVLYLAVWRHPAFDERLDGIVYATRAGLGFALVENVGYLLDSKSFAGFLGIWVMRAALAVPGHAIYAGFMGYHAARKRFDGKGPGLWGGLAIAIFLHGTYDAALFTMGTLKGNAQLFSLLLLPIPLIVVVAGFFRLRALARRAEEADDIAHARPVLRLPLGMGFVLR